MIDILERTGEATCGNCGGKIIRLFGSMTAEHWTHEDERGLRRECRGALMASPEATGPSHAAAVLLLLADEVDDIERIGNTAGRDMTRAESVRWTASPLTDLYPAVHNAERPRVVISQWLRDRAAQLGTPVDVAGLCHWNQNYRDAQQSWTHEAFHFGNPCPYEAVAAILRGDPDPREAHHD